MPEVKAENQIKEAYNSLEIASRYLADAQQRLYAAGSTALAMDVQLAYGMIQTVEDSCLHSGC